VLAERCGFSIHTMAHRHSHIGSSAAGAFRTGCSHDGAPSQRHCRRLTLCLEPTSKRDPIAQRDRACVFETIEAADIVHGLKDDDNAGRFGFMRQ
jgi:hypothetical protein